MKVQLSNISKSFGAQNVLDKASLTVKNNEKIALVGRNGCGKTTLLKILTQEELPDCGTRNLASGTVIGSLNQIVFDDENKTVEDELSSVFDSLKKLEKEIEAQSVVLETDHSDKQLEKYDRLATRFQAMGGYDYEYEMKSVFQNFGFELDEMKKQLKEFSSGQRTRIALIKLLLKKPDILLLDEPTNHLDIETIEWLEGYLKHYPNAVIMVSHDRTFLDHVADEVVEIEFGKTTRYPGNYSHYLKAKEEFLARNHEAYLRQEKEVQRLEALIEKFRYKRSKAAFAQSKIKYLERMDRIEDSTSDRSKITAAFTAGRKGGNRVLEAEELQIGYDQILSTVNLELFRQDRMAIVGPNGIGKSTLVKTLVDLIPPKGGSYRFGHQIDIGYFDQDSAQMKSVSNVIDDLWDAHPQSTQTEIRNVLASFLFTQDEVFKDVADLSGGERVRLAFAHLMMDHDNLLILDEPTNHLDIPAREALENALKDYDGTILFVSHDRTFLSKMATRILEVGKTSTVYESGYDEYIEKKKEGKLSLLKQASKEGGKKAAVEQKKNNSGNRENKNELSRQEKKSMQNRIKRLEELIPEAEQEVDRLEELRYDPEYYHDYRKMEELEEKIDTAKNQLETYMQEWEEKLTLVEGN